MSCHHEAISLESGKERDHQGRAGHLVREYRRLDRGWRIAGHPGSPEPGEIPQAARFRGRMRRLLFLVSFVEEDDSFFLKTVIPSRKATRDYLNRGEADAED